jgi:hypothetical protein
MWLGGERFYTMGRERFMRRLREGKVGTHQGWCLSSLLPLMMVGVAMQQGLHGERACDLVLDSGYREYTIFLLHQP